MNPAMEKSNISNVNIFEKKNTTLETLCRESIIKIVTDNFLLCFPFFKIIFQQSGI